MTENSSDKLNLSPDQQALWEKLQDFPFDTPGAAKPFSHRLAQEQGWSPEFTSRVLEEYRRFLFLTAVAQHPICPSEDVDAAWHQHLVYTRSYWQDLCHEILGDPLHHDPTAGGPQELDKHWDMYEQTLVTYHRTYGQTPPRDVWPPPHVRFNPASRPRQVDLSRAWIIPKPAWWSRVIPRRIGLTAAFIPLLAIGLGPLDWTGPNFLKLDIGLYVTLLAISLLVRRLTRLVEVTKNLKRTPQNIAFLSFGPKAVVNATIAGMLQDRELVSINTPSKFGALGGSTVTFAPGPNAPPHEKKLARAIYQTVQITPQKLPDLQKILASELLPIEQQLIDSGYLISASRVFWQRVLTLVPMLILLAFGIAKLIVGLNRHKPIEILAILCGMTFLTTLLLLIKNRRTIAAEAELKSLKYRHDSLKSKLTDERCPGAQVALCAALFGASALSGSLFSDLRTVWRSSQDAGFGTSSGDSGCGGGGCGGGGCGGGGCGGCS